MYKEEHKERVFGHIEVIAGQLAGNYIIDNGHHQGRGAEQEMARIGQAQYEATNNSQQTEQGEEQ